MLCTVVLRIGSNYWKLVIDNLRVKEISILKADILVTLIIYVEHASLDIFREW